jgi:hypothetical protein
MHARSRFRGTLGVGVLAVALGAAGCSSSSDDSAARTADSPRISATEAATRQEAPHTTAGVVGKFVEFFGPGVSSIPVETRVTLANISPEYGAWLSIIAVRPKPVPVGPRAGRWR